MSDNYDPLSQLWLEQDVEKIDLDVIKKKWRITELKQRLYLLIDIFSTLFVFAILYFMGDELDHFTYKIFVVLNIICLGYLVYVTWLRRFSLGWSDLAAEQHIQKLKKQINNNILIANLSKSSVYLLLVIVVVHEIGLYYFELTPPEKLMRKLIFDIVFHAIALPSMWIWADRRCKRFKRELTALNELFGSSKSV
jgi:hypothetical protein